MVMDGDVCLFLGFVLHVGITIGSHRPHGHNYDHAQMEPPFLKVTMVFTCAIIFDNPHLTIIAESALEFTDILQQNMDAWKYETYFSC